LERETHAEGNTTILADKIKFTCNTIFSACIAHLRGPTSHKHATNSSASNSHPHAAHIMQNQQFPNQESNQNLVLHGNEGSLIP